VLLWTLLPRPPRLFARAIRRATAEHPARRFADAHALVDAVVRRRRPPALLAATTCLAVAVPFLLPPPRGVRAAWDPAWGADHIPGDAWNVALNGHEAGLPAMASAHDGTGCARSLRDLNDGVAQYPNWQRGFAFPGPQAMCVNFELLGYCGGLKPDALLCAMGPQGGRRLALRVRDRGQVAPKADEALGQLEPPGDCSEDYAVELTLDRPRTVFAVRAWFHSGLPTRFGIHAEDGAGGWRPVFQTVDNRQGIDPPYRRAAHDLSGSEPVTAEFPPTRTRRLRYTVRCESQDPLDPGRRGQPVWLYELEAFAQVWRPEAWWRAFGQRR
jgi:hypothetical protein